VLMKWRNVKWIYLREIRDQLRDRRTLFTIFVLPLLLYPLLGMGVLQVAQFSREHMSPVLVVGAESLPEQPPLLRVVEGSDGKAAFAEAVCPGEEQRLVQLSLAPARVPVDNDVLRSYAEQQIQSGKFDAVVYFPPNLAEKLAEFRGGLAATDDERAEPGVPPLSGVPEPAIFTNSANDKSRIARDRVERVLDRWRKSIVTRNLREKNVPAAVTEPFRVVKTDVARESSRRAAMWSKILPFIALIWALTGAFYPAVDLCAGEKERGTLETLLCSPAQRIEIVWGKLLTIMSFSMATSLLNLASLGATGAFIVTQIERQGGTLARTVIGAPPLAALLWLVLALVPLSALFSALSLAVAAFARSSREGQYYLMPLLFITLPLVMLSMMPTAELDLGTSLIPVTGVMLLLRSLIEGHFAESLRFVAPVIAITTVCCGMAVNWAVRQFNNESVLFRESERFGLGIWMYHLRRDRRETPSLAEALFCGVLLLLLMRFFAPLVVEVPRSWTGFAATTIVTLVAFVATPALIMALILTRNVRRTLLLQMPSPSAMLLASGLAVAIHPAGIALGQFVSQLYPLSPTIEAHARSLQGIIDLAPNFGAVLVVLALVPAICEELAFRGFILSGIRGLGSTWTAIVGSAVFFGATHAFVQQSLTACALGVVLGYVAVQTRSLLPGLAFHFVYNSLSLLIGREGPFASGAGRAAWLFEWNDGDFSYRWPAVALSVIISAMILRMLRQPAERVAAQPAEQPGDAVRTSSDSQSAIAGVDQTGRLCKS
jgi:sodium transport system permease protein